MPENPFDGLFFWLRLVSLDYSGFFGVCTNTYGGKPSNKENN
jgi:hypothetical protein